MDSGVYAFAHRAVVHGDLDAFKAVAALDPTALRARGASGLTPFLAACAAGHLHIARWLVAEGHAAVDEREPRHGATALHLAVAQRQTRVVAWLVHAAPCLVNAPTTDGAGPLHAAAEIGAVDLIHTLIQHHAHTDMPDRRGLTPLYVAATPEAKAALTLSGEQPHLPRNSSTSSLSSVFDCLMRHEHESSLLDSPVQPIDNNRITLAKDAQQGTRRANMATENFGAQDQVAQRQGDGSLLDASGARSRHAPTNAKGDDSWMMEATAVREDDLKGGSRMDCTLHVQSSTPRSHQQQHHTHETSRAWSLARGASTHSNSHVTPRWADIVRALAGKAPSSPELQVQLRQEHAQPRQQQQQPRLEVGAGARRGGVGGEGRGVEKTVIVPGASEVADAMPATLTTRSARDRDASSSVSLVCGTTTIVRHQGSVASGSFELSPGVVEHRLGSPEEPRSPVAPASAGSVTDTDAASITTSDVTLASADHGDGHDMRAAEAQALDASWSSSPLAQLATDKRGTSPAPATTAAPTGRGAKAARRSSDSEPYNPACTRRCTPTRAPPGRRGGGEGAPAAAGRVRTQQGVRPHVCRVCKRTFGTNSNLQRHLRSHNGDKPYQCGLCGKRFTNSSNRRKHEKTCIMKRAAAKDDHGVLRVSRDFVDYHWHRLEAAKLRIEIQPPEEPNNDPEDSNNHNDNTNSNDDTNHDDGGPR
ncbi:hypothetical protein PTSG_00487 [Salpingoeca rosetta]|uniref:C2H2-type domain-containing protein n=1 Tax=Salpingoeca rosetta (strain ATCC 50818 / BSB-021) TaxID=946362 RepID=F2TWL7_SALR5|nr:uncharacterized protein PTSG_00487 [Salpingoeca rosetta]EGD72463.1 hypothetical protein PTSG_00487 [Salpingoeca rosetta]|eukprot:XP_004999032.1 hypothetical protein PTSG_00487 [Salpingoeca rosetta]